MNDTIRHLAVEVELRPGEKLALPPALVDCVGAGRWLITVESVVAGAPIRRHSAFLNGYATEDEGLYDADAGR